MIWGFTTLFALAFVLGYAVTAVLARRQWRAALAVPAGVLVSLVGLALVFWVMVSQVHDLAVAFVKVHLPALFDQLMNAISHYQEAKG